MVAWEGCSVGAADLGAGGAVVLVSIFNCLTFIPESLRSRTPGVVVRLAGLEVVPSAG